MRGVTLVRKTSLEYGVNALLDVWEKSHQGPYRSSFKRKTRDLRDGPMTFDEKKSRGAFRKSPIYYSLFLIALCACSQKLALLLVLVTAYVFMSHTLTSMV